MPRTVRPHIRARASMAGAGAVRITTSHHRRGFGVIVGDYYDGDYGYYGGCEWLRVRAEETGSGYWRRRYEDCIEG
jgi:hypothetical protein